MPAAVAVAGLVGTVYAANKQSKAAKSAAQAQTQAAGDANKLQWQMFQQARQDNEPFRQNALAAQQEYMALMGLGSPQTPGAQTTPQGTQGVNSQGAYTLGPYANNPFEKFAGGGSGSFDGSTMGPLMARNTRIFDPVDRGMAERGGIPRLGQQPPQQAAAPATPAQTPQQLQQSAFDRFRNTPGYQFGLQTGFDQVQASAAARGGLFSGATMKALQKFGNDYADQQGYTPYMNRLASLAGMGQTANAQNAQMGMNYANQAGANLINAGNARASGIQNSANAWSQGIGNAVGIGGWLAGQYDGGGTNAYGWRGF